MDVPLTEGQQKHLLQVKREECIQGNITQARGTCPRIWDGILCWPETQPGLLSTQLCPSYFRGFHNGNATKYCTENGTWFYSVEEENTWTNYTDCLNGTSATVVLPIPFNPGNITMIAKYIPALKTLSQIGYSISLTTLIIAFIILASFKKLRCPRNVLHMHLFVSFILRAAISLLKHRLFIEGLGLPSDFEGSIQGYLHSDVPVNWGCKLLTGLWQYCITANYSWILMEGLYLHNLIFLALFSDTSAITTYILLGWGLPVLFIIPWVIVRATLEDDLCWTTHKNTNYFLIIKVPIMISIVLNFGLFLNIVRVLLLKLTASISEEKRRFRRWAKSTLVLVPLFGAHYAFFIWMSYSVGINETIELIWLFCDQTFASFQGSFVAILYCFLNGEVQAEVLKRGRNPNQTYSMSEKSTAPFIRLFRPRKNRKRGGSTFESCMTSFISSAPTSDVQRRVTLPPQEFVSQMNEQKLDSCLLSKGEITKNGRDTI